MNILIVLMIVLFIIMGILFIFIMRMKPVHKKHTKKNYNDIHSETDYSSLYQKRLQSIQYYWPKLKLYLGYESFPHGILIHYKGLTETDQPLLLTIDNRDMFHSCMDALKRLVKEKGIVQYDTWIALPFFPTTTDLFLQEVYDVFLLRKIKPIGVIRNGNNDIKRNPYIWVGHGLSAYSSYTLQGNKRHLEEWKNNFHFHRKEYPNKEGYKPYVSIYGKERDMIDTQLPISTVMIYPHAVIKDNELILTSYDDETMNKMKNYFHQSLADVSLYMHENETMYSSHISNETEALALIIQKCLMDTFDAKGVQFYQVENKKGIHLFVDWDVYWFMPSQFSEEIIPYKGIEFFYRLLKH